MTTENYETVLKAAESLTEAEAIYLILQLQERHGFAGTFFTRQDAEQEWQHLMLDTRQEIEDEINVGPMPDVVWDNIQQSWEWGKGLTERLTEIGWDMVVAAVLGAIDS